VLNLFVEAVRHFVDRNFLGKTKGGRQIRVKVMVSAIGLSLLGLGLGFGLGLGLGLILVRASVQEIQRTSSPSNTSLSFSGAEHDSPGSDGPENDTPQFVDEL